MQVCSTCEDFDKCRLKEADFFEICPKLVTLNNGKEKRHDCTACTEKTDGKVGKKLNITDTRIDFKTLNKYFGYSKFRPLQNEIILDVLDGKDVLVLMPTGGGKSLCCQYPSLLSDGLTIVVSPLISLMKNQVDRLKSNGINAEYINSSLDYHEIKGIKSGLSQNKIKLVYIAPERLTTSSFLAFLKSLRISLFAIDEAHCIFRMGT